MDYLERIKPQVASLVDPITSEIIDLKDADDIAEALSRTYQTLASLNGFRTHLCAAAAYLARFDGASRTGRVRGKRLRLAVELPGDSWDQAILRRLWDFSPDLAPQFLAIGSLRVKLREYQKLLRESGPAGFERFRADLLTANRGPQGTPRVTVESL